MGNKTRMLGIGRWDLCWPLQIVFLNPSLYKRAWDVCHWHQLSQTRWIFFWRLSSFASTPVVLIRQTFTSAESNKFIMRVTSHLFPTNDHADTRYALLWMSYLINTDTSDKTNVFSGDLDAISYVDLNYITLHNTSINLLRLHLDYLHDRTVSDAFHCARSMQFPSYFYILIFDLGVLVK